MGDNEKKTFCGTNMFFPVVNINFWGVNEKIIAFKTKTIVEKNFPAR